jgi:hypothetical protein
MFVAASNRPIPTSAPSTHSPQTSQRRSSISFEAIGFSAGTFTPYHYGWVPRGAGIAAIAAADEGGKACVFFANTQVVKVLGKDVVPGQHRRCF